MRTLLVLTAIFLGGCATTVPVTAKFPDAPPELLKKCVELQQVEPGKNSITDLLKTVVNNYTLYYQCANRVEGWQEWHKQQKAIFEKAGK